MAYIYTHFKGIRKYALNETNLEKLKNKKIWIDIKNPSTEELLLLQAKLKIHPTTIEDIQEHDSRVKVEQFRRYLEIVMYDIVKEGDELVTKEIDFIVGKNFIISAYSHDVPEFEKLKTHKRKFPKLSNKGTDSLLHYMIDSVLNHFIPFLEELDQKIDALEEVVIHDSDKSILARILAVRQEIIMIKKYIHPEREKLGILAKGNHNFISGDILPYFRDLYDDAIRISESIESSREGITAVYDIYMSTISFNTNEVMKVLSIAATVMLPLTFITGIFGMNFIQMPWLKNPYGFWLIMGIMVILTMGMIIFFKKEKWL